MNMDMNMNACAAAAPEAEVPSMLYRLDAGLQTLVDRLADLEARLVPVLSIRPTGEDGCGSLSVNTPMGARLRNQLETVEYLTRRIILLNETMEL
jgi:hypothetical protein